MKYIDMSRYIDIMRKSKKSTPSFPVVGNKKALFAMC